MDGHCKEKFVIFSLAGFDRKIEFVNIHMIKMFIRNINCAILTIFLIFISFSAILLQFLSVLKQMRYMLILTVMRIKTGSLSNSYKSTQTKITIRENAINMC